MKDLYLEVPENKNKYFIFSHISLVLITGLEQHLVLLLLFMLANTCSSLHIQVHSENTFIVENQYSIRI